MAKVYIEYREERIETLNASLFFDHNSNHDLDDKQNEEEGKIESIMFAPLFAYRTPFEGAIEWETNFDINNITMLHIVIVRYEKQDNIGTDSGKWYIYGVYKTRREALKNSEIIDSEEELWKGKPWDEEGCSYEGVDVISVLVED